jgi:NarL family two-component system response regulator LiaR
MAAANWEGHVIARWWAEHPMARIVVLWSLVLAVGAFVLQWLQYQYVVRVFSPQIYIAIIGVLFAAGGVWVGWKLSARPAPSSFARNDAALGALGLTGQEIKVLERLAAGDSNKEIARTFGLSPNTVKTHIANLFGKLDVVRRSQAVAKARELSLIP